MNKNKTKIKLFGMSLSELVALTAQHGLPKYVASQIAGWLYQRDISEISEMTNLSKKFRTALEEGYEVGIKEVVKQVKSKDGTAKYLFELDKGELVETALIPNRDRMTACISTQVGCKMGCRFCMTAQQGWQGSLIGNEILNQYRSVPEFKKITNIVYMGMGEPFDNYSEVMKSLDVLTSAWGYGMSPRRITVSTIGILDKTIDFINQSAVHLAISLHAANDKLRNDIMPATKPFPLKDLISSLHKHNWRGQRRLTFEYLLFNNVNDSIENAIELAKLIRGLNARVNLLNYHQLAGVNLFPASNDRVHAFQKSLEESGIGATIRRSMGEDVRAACGLLSSLNSEKYED